MRPVTDEIPTELFEFTARDYVHCIISLSNLNCDAESKEN